MLKRIIIGFLLFANSILAFEKEDMILNRIKSHIILEDFYSALKEAKNGIDIYPKSIDLNKAYISSLAYCGKDVDALKVLNSLTLNLEKIKNDSEILEEIAWSILKKGIQSSQYMVRLSSMIGAFFANDAKGVSILKQMLEDSNVIIRSIALQLSSHYKDDILKEKVKCLLDSEKIWFVRLEILNAIGKMKIKDKANKLKEILKNDKITYEERNLAIKALTNIYEDINVEELNVLLNSSFAGFRSLGCELAYYFKIKDVSKKILTLALDPIVDVRISALNAIGLYFKDFIDDKKLNNVLDQTYNDSNAFVSITSSWVGLVVKSKGSKVRLKKWLFDKYAENRRFAAAAIAQSGSLGTSLALFALKNSNDPFVKTIVGLALIGQRKNVKNCCDVIYDFIKNKKHIWMWDTRSNSLFKVLAPTEIRHTDQLPNYPEAIDQIIQLNLLSTLAILGDKRADEVIKTFLKRKIWGITGIASVMLLQEGNKESLSLLHKLLNDPNKNIRIQAALALATIGKDTSVLSVLEEAYFSADHKLKLHILEAMGVVANKKSFPFLLKVLQEPFQIIKIAASAAIIKIANS